MTYTNPVIFADVPDPDIIRVGDTYYMTSTTMYFTPGCPIMKSTDLVNWELVGYVYDTICDNDHMTLTNGKHDYGRGSWASVLRYYNGTFYVSFVAYNTNTTYIYQTEDIENGLWRKYEIEGIYHDMSILFDNDGRVYMVYGAGAIKVVELTPDATAIKPGGLNKIIIPNADPSGANSLAEGAHIYKIDGYYYIFIIAWPKTGSGRRVQVCFRASSIDGLYQHKVILDDDIGFTGAGIAQGGIVDTPDGHWYALLFQDHRAVGRLPVLLPVQWQDGWPSLSVGDAGKLPVPFAGTIHQPQTLTISDDFNLSKLALQWQWNHNPDNTNWSLLARPGWLRLTTGRVVKHLFEAPNTLTQRTFNIECSATIKIDTANMKDGDCAGLALLQEKYGFVGVRQVNGQRYIVMEAHDGEATRIPLAQDIVYMAANCVFASTVAPHAPEIGSFSYSLDGNDFSDIGNSVHMEYRLSHFTGYRFALFNYATQSTGGYVDFDWIKVK